MSSPTKKVAVITGGASGMGLAVAKRLAEENWYLILVDLNERDGAKAIVEVGDDAATFVRADVTAFDDQLAVFERAVAEHGRIDFVFANAGVAGTTGFSDKSDQWPPKPPSMLVQEVNLTGVVYTCYLAMHFMRRNEIPGGVIVMTASAASLYAAPELPLYTAAKHGVLGLMRSMSMALVDEGIRVNCTLPGAIRTGLHPDETWSQLGHGDFTPIEQVVDTVLGLVKDPKATGKAMEISAGEVFDRQQPDFSNETMARIMNGISY